MALIYTGASDCQGCAGKLNALQADVSKGNSAKSQQEVTFLRSSPGGLRRWKLLVFNVSNRIVRRTERTFPNKDIVNDNRTQTAGL